ncbi:hypothetical protein CHUAL_001347 [Chamberlinius hualienensis]
MFRSLMQDFHDDAMFGFSDQMTRMERMMNGFMGSVGPFDDMFSPSFGVSPFPALMAPIPTHRIEQHDRRNHRSRPNDALTPFGFGNLFPRMDRMPGDPSCHSFSSSSVMTYSLGDDGQPKVYQASSTTRMAPGGVKETTKTVTNSATGEQKMRIDRQLGEKAHVVEKTQNRYTGDQDESEEFLNMDDGEVETFNHEWKQRTGVVGTRSANQIASHPYQRPTLAITDGRQESSQKRGKKLAGKKDKKSQSKSR